MTPLYFTPLYRVQRRHTGKGWHLTLQRRKLFWWRDLQTISISLNSDTRYDAYGVEYWPCKGFSVRKRAGGMWMEWMEKLKK